MTKMKKPTAYDSIIKELRQNAVLSAGYKDHLIVLIQAATSEAYKRGRRSSGSQVTK